MLSVTSFFYGSVNGRGLSRRRAGEILSASALGRSGKINIGLRRTCVDKEYAYLTMNITWYICWIYLLNIYVYIHIYIYCFSFIYIWGPILHIQIYLDMILNVHKYIIGNMIPSHHNTVMIIIIILISIYFYYMCQLSQTIIMNGLSNWFCHNHPVLLIKFNHVYWFVIIFLIMLTICLTASVSSKSMIIRIVIIINRIVAIVAAHSMFTNVLNMLSFITYLFGIYF